MACDLIMNIFLCGGVQIFRWFLNLFIPIGGLPLNMLSIAVSSIFIYTLVKLLGRLGGIILSILGVVGVVFTAGVSLALTMIGLLITFFERSVMLIIAINAGLYVLCMVLGCI